MSNSGYQPPEPPGPRTQTPLPVAVLAVTLLVLAIAVLVICGGMLAFRLLAAADDDRDNNGARDTAAAGDAQSDALPDDASESRTGELAVPLEFRHVTSATPGPCPAGSTGFTLRDPDECIEVESGPEVSEVADIAAVESAGQFVVRVSLLPADATELHRYTRELSGERVALISGDEAIMAPQVNGPIPATFDISDNLTATEAEELAARLRGEQ